MYLISSLTPFLSNFVCILDNQCMFSCTPTVVMANWQRFDGKDHDFIKRSASLLLSKGIDIEEEGKIFSACCITMYFPVRKKEQHLNDLSCVFHNSWKHGSEILKATDPFEALIAICGKVFIGKSLSKFSCSQVAGLMGLVVTTFAPQVHF